jgi:hypothetical protein
MSVLVILAGVACVGVAAGVLIGFLLLRSFIRRTNASGVNSSDESLLSDKVRIPLAQASKYDFDIVGEASYLSTLRRIDGGRLARGKTVITPVLVVPEPTNEYDANAIAVLVEGFGKIGHFSRDAALEWASVSHALQARNAVGVSYGWLMGGTAEKPNIGVWLCLKTPKRTLAELLKG